VHDPPHAEDFVQARVVARAAAKADVPAEGRAERAEAMTAEDAVAIDAEGADAQSANPVNLSRKFLSWPVLLV
jgi:hypothetical protein